MGMRLSMFALLLHKICGEPSPAAAGPEACETSNSCSHDEPSLLQVNSKAGSSAWLFNGTKRCRGYPVSRESQAIPILPEIAPDTTIGWWNMPPQPMSVGPNAIADNLTEFTDFPHGDPHLDSFLDMTRFSLVGAEEAAHIMYKATKVDGVTDKVPEHLRGVFWMKGNAVPEELTVFQFGRWFPDQDKHVMPYSPFTWAHPAGRPNGAPKYGAMYSKDVTQGGYNAALSAMYPYSLSYKFSRCPRHADCYGKNALGNMSYANMQIHAFGDLTQAVDKGELPSANFPVLEKAGKIEGVFTLEAQEQNSPNMWRRKCKWSLNSPGCASMEYGSYDLVRLLDGEGKEVTYGRGWRKGSYLKDFIQYMGDLKLIIWSGFKDEASRNRLVAQSQMV